MTSLSARPTPGDRPLPIKLNLGWGLGSLSMSAMFQATTVLLLHYLVDDVGVVAATAGLLIGASKIYDAVVDPFIGMVSDRTRSPWGRRRPYLLLGSVVSALSFYALFSLPVGAPPTLKAVLATMVLVVNATGYALFVIPYLAMPAEMTTSPKARTTLMGYRISATALGQICGSFVGPLVIAAGGGGLAGHHLMALVLAGLILAVGAACFLLTADAAQTAPPKKHHYSIPDQVRLALGNSPFATLMGVKISTLFGLALQTSATPFFFTRLLHESFVQLGYYFLARGLALFISQPAWVFVSNRIGKKAAYQLSSLLYMLCMLALLFCGGSTPFVAVLGLGLLTGLASGGVLLVGQALLPDTIEHDFRRTGLRREGVFSGVYTTVEKVSFALATAVLGGLLTAMGYVQAGAHGHGAAEPASALHAIRLALALPIAFQALSSLIMMFYSVDLSAPTPARLADLEEIDGASLLTAAAP